MRQFRNAGISCTILLASVLCLQLTFADPQAAGETNSNNPETNLATAIFAGGCFWCMEADFDKVEGVQDVVSGYSGGAASTATYKQVSHTETGHFEVVEVSYDPQVVSYAELVEYFWRHIDPTDPDGQFCDKGSSYRSAIFYGSEQEQKIVADSLARLQENKPFTGDIATTVAAAMPFYKAEDYHQNYYQRNPLRYNFYRTGCGRDKRIKELWG